MELVAYWLLRTTTRWITNFRFVYKTYGMWRKVNVITLINGYLLNEFGIHFLEMSATNTGTLMRIH